MPDENSRPPKQSVANRVFDRDSPLNDRTWSVPIRKQTSTALIIALVVGGVGLILIGGAVLAGILYWDHTRIKPEAEWVTFTPPDDRCTIQMPGTPVMKPLNINGANAQKYICHEKNDTFFFIAYLDLPGNPRPDLLTTSVAAEREYLLKTLPDSRLESERDLPPNPYPARELQIKPTKGTGTMVERILIVKTKSGTRMYVLAAGGPKIYPDSRDTVRFFASFHPVDPPN
jgi:hypothetical protein